MGIQYIHVAVFKLVISKPVIFVVFIKTEVSINVYIYDTSQGVFFPVHKKKSVFPFYI